MTPEELLGRVAGVRLLVVGEMFLDVFVFGRVERISPEAPVPVVVHERTLYRSSGVSSAAQAAVRLCAGVDVVSVVGDDDDGRRTVELLAAEGVATDHVLADPARVTGRKCRVLGNGQHLLRFDHETTDPLDEATETVVVAQIATAVERSDAVLVSDYVKGVCTSAVLRACLAARERGVPVVIDPKLPAPARYAGATVLTPNEAEPAGFADRLGTTGAPVRDAAEALRRAGEHDWVVATRGAAGMTTVGPDGVFDTPAAARTVTDVAGAGDAAAAGIALGLGAGLTIRNAIRLGAWVAGVVVGRWEDKTVQPADVLAIAAV